MEMEEAKLEVVSPIGREYTRSDARVKYGKGAYNRKVASRSPNHVKPKEATKATTFKERVVLQAIICGSFLAVLLLFNIVDTGFTNSVVDWIDRNIAHNALSDEDGTGWVESVLQFFRGGQEADRYEGTYYDAYSPITNIPIPAINTPPGGFSVDYSRIDENVLRDIEAHVDVYLENNRP